MSSRTQQTGPPGGRKRNQEQRSYVPTHQRQASNYWFSFRSCSTKVIQVRGWRFAPACCAAQSVGRAQRRSSALRSTPASIHKATEALPGLCLLYPTHRAPSSSSWKTSVPPRWQTYLATCGRSGKPARSAGRCTLHLQESDLRFAILASPMAHGCQTHYFQLRR